MAMLPPRDPAEEPLPPARRSGPRRIARWAGGVVLGLLALIVLVVAFLHTVPGRRFIVAQISSYAPASGLSVDVGAIDGSILWSATLHDVRFRDANDVLFLEVPEIDLNWRPYKFLWSGLDIRHLVLSGGTFYAAPQLIPGDPDAPALPDFDIRIDRLLIDHLTVAQGLLGEERVIDFRARTDIRDGLVFLDATGDLGGGDVFTALVHAQPDGNQFDLDLNYQAPAGGFLAALVGSEQDLALRLAGDGTWTDWRGNFDAVQGGVDLADLAITNQAGRYRIAGSLRPGVYLEGLGARALGEEVKLDANGTLVDSVLDGTLALSGRGVDAHARGAVDLADNAFDGVMVDARLFDPALFGSGLKLEDARLQATLDGAFRSFEMPHELRIGQLTTGGGIVARGIVQRGTLGYDGTRFTLPLDMRVARVVSGIRIADPRLVNGRIGGTLTYRDNRLRSDGLALRFPGLAADLTLQADLARDAVELVGAVNARGLALRGIGILDARARVRVSFGRAPWRLSAGLDGAVRNVTNPTLANLAGEPIRFTGGVALGQGVPIVFTNTRIAASKLDLVLDGRLVNGETTFAGSGEHMQYGAFTVEATIADDGPRATFVFASPLPAAGLTDVRAALAPTEEGFAIETEGGSTLGPFDGLVNLVIPEGGDVRLGIERLDVSDTRITGDLALADGGVAGTLRLARGGVDGTLALSPRGGGQAFDADIRFANASFGGATPIAINQGTLDARGFIGAGTTTIQGKARLAGLGYGSLFLRRVAAQAQITDGRGTFDGAIAGQRGSRFELLVNGRVAPERIALALRGQYAGRAITMPRRAVLTATPDGGWRLAKTQLGYGGGYALLEGRFAGEAPVEASVGLSAMPLSLADALGADLGLGGTVSGLVEVGADGNGQPVGSARLKVDGLTRSGIVLTSRPIDLALVADLSSTVLQARAVMNDGGGAAGRLQARIADLPPSGPLAERLFAGDLNAQFRFQGPAASLWRLAAVDLIDLSGPLDVAADISGTLADPRVRGSLAGDDLQLQSPLTGTNITAMRARGRFAGSRLALTSFTGTAPNGGRVSGSGIVDLGNLGPGRGPRLDLRIAASNAQILDLPAMGATVTGPLRIVSNGVGGTLAGRLTIRRARWRLGAAAETNSLPSVTVSETNLPPDIAPARATGAPWRYLIDASARSGIEVDGMGLDSEWRGNVELRGTTADPRIGGEVEIVPRRGFYSFAGSRFEITRGRIVFGKVSPPDPRIDIVAESTFDGTDVAVNVSGTASQPEITFSSVPALPEEELLARILFGGSVTELSATDALQLGSALASLRGGGGMGPINRLRTAIGLDRLRLVPADPALNRGTAVALGKNITRSLYTEVITDGASYNATELEFRVTSWLSLLGSVSTVGRHSVGAEYSRDY